MWKYKMGSQFSSNFADTQWFSVHHLCRLVRIARIFFSFSLFPQIPHQTAATFLLLLFAHRNYQLFSAYVARFFYLHLSQRESGRDRPRELSLYFPFSSRFSQERCHSEELWKSTGLYRSLLLRIVEIHRAGLRTLQKLQVYKFRPKKLFLFW